MYIQRDRSIVTLLKIISEFFDVTINTFYPLFSNYRRTYIVTQLYKYVQYEPLSTLRLFNKPQLDISHRWLIMRKLIAAEQVSKRIYENEFMDLLNAPSSLLAALNVPQLTISISKVYSSSANRIIDAAIISFLHSYSGTNITTHYTLAIAQYSLNVFYRISRLDCIPSSIFFFF